MSRLGLGLTAPLILVGTLTACSDSMYPTGTDTARIGGAPDPATLVLRSPGRVVTGPGSGIALVRSFDATTGAEIESLMAYPTSFTGGVRVAAGDVTGDGIADIVTGAGPGGGPHIKVFDGATRSVAMDFFAFAPSFASGVFVAAGDVNGDGYADIVTGAGAGGGPHVRVFDGAGGQVIADFFAYAPSFTGGVHVAAGDVNGDGHADIVTGAGSGAGPHVKVFDGATGAETMSLFAFNPTFTGGVFVAAGDTDGDGYADIVAGAGAGGGPHVKVLDGRSGDEIAAFFAYAASFTGGVRVATGDVNGDGYADIVTGAGAGGGPHVKVFDGQTGAEATSFFAYDPAFIGGIHVAATAQGEAAPPPVEVGDLIDAADAALADGTLYGAGNGSSAAGRAGAWQAMLVEAARLIDIGSIEEACDQLRQAYLRADGDAPPPDFVEGPARETLADMVLALMLQLGCGA